MTPTHMPSRTSYDHIAGRLGAGLAGRLTVREFVILGNGAGEVTPAGVDFLSSSESGERT